MYVQTIPGQNGRSDYCEDDVQEVGGRESVSNKNAL